MVSRGRSWTKLCILFGQQGQVTWPLHTSTQNSHSITHHYPPPSSMSPAVPHCPPPPRTFTPTHDVLRHGCDAKQHSQDVHKVTPRCHFTPNSTTWKKTTTKDWKHDECEGKHKREAGRHRKGKQQGVQGAPAFLFYFILFYWHFPMSPQLTSPSRTWKRCTSGSPIPPLYSRACFSCWSAFHLPLQPPPHPLHSLALPSSHPLPLLSPPGPSSSIRHKKRTQMGALFVFGSPTPSPTWKRPHIWGHFRVWGLSSASPSHPFHQTRTSRTQKTPLARFSCSAGSSYWGGLPNPSLQPETKMCPYVGAFLCLAGFPPHRASPDLYCPATRKTHPVGKTHPVERIFRVGLPPQPSPADQHGKRAHMGMFFVLGCLPVHSLPSNMKTYPS